MTLYRIAQEGLTNVLRHGTGATGVDLRLVWTNDAVELEIVDDGTPPTATEPSAGSGRGLTGMRERAALNGATLSAGPVPDGGWRVATRIPLSADASISA